MHPIVVAGTPAIWTIGTPATTAGAPRFKFIGGPIEFDDLAAILGPTSTFKFRCIIRPPICRIVPGDLLITSNWSNSLEPKFESTVILHHPAIWIATMIGVIDWRSGRSNPISRPNLHPMVEFILWNILGIHTIEYLALEIAEIGPSIYVLGCICRFTPLVTANFYLRHRNRYLSPPIWRWSHIRREYPVRN